MYVWECGWILDSTMWRTPRLYMVHVRLSPYVQCLPCNTPFILSFLLLQAFAQNGCHAPLIEQEKLDFLEKC